MTPDEIREQVRYHMREIERLQQEAAMNQEVIDRLQVALWNLQYEEQFKIVYDSLN